MTHDCLKKYTGPNQSMEHDEPCICDCKYCVEFKRFRSLSVLSVEERQEIWHGFIHDLTGGPWRAAQLEGFGAMRFLITESPKERWHSIVAILEHAGSFDGDRWLAWCHDGVPRLLLTIEQLEKEIEDLKKQLREK